MKDGSEEKMMPLFWLHAPSLVSIGQSNATKPGFQRFNQVLI